MCPSLQVFETSQVSNFSRFGGRACIQQPLRCHTISYSKRSISITTMIIAPHAHKIQPSWSTHLKQPLKDRCSAEKRWTSRWTAMDSQPNCSLSCSSSSSPSSSTSNVHTSTTRATSHAPSLSTCRRHRCDSL